MVFEICSDIDNEVFEVRTKDQRFAQYPSAMRSRWNERTIYVPISKRNWYKDLESIASFVNNELKAKDGTPEACTFCLG